MLRNLNRSHHDNCRYIYVSGSALTNKKVLIINDDSFQLSLFGKYLEKTDISVVTFSEPEKALTALLKEETFDLIITDIYMPKVDGWKICRLLRSSEFARYNETPILVTSATFNGVEAEDISQEIGANAFTGVPISSEPFIDLVQHLLSGKTKEKKRTALVVEDDPTQAKIIELAFQKDGIQTQVAHTGVQAQLAVETAEFDLLVLDYHLPDCQADQLLIELKEARPDIIPIIITADNQPEKSIELLNTGAYSYIVKPFKPSYLLEITHMALRERSLLRVESLLEQRTKESLRNEANYKLLLNNIPLGVLEINADGLIAFANQETFQLLEKTDAELMNSKLSGLIDPSHGLTHEDMWKSCEETSLKSQIWQWKGLDKKIQVSSSWKQSLDEDPNKKILILILEDVSHQKELEKIKEHKKMNAFNNHKMLSLAELSSGISHEINNPLAISLQNTQNILDKWEELLSNPSKLKANVEKINVGCKRIHKITQSLKEITEVYSDNELPQLSLTQLISDINKLYQEKILSSGIDFQITNSDDELFIKGNATELSQVIINLLDNALYALKSDSNEDEKRISIELFNNNGEASIEVTDNSSQGVATDIKETLFDPFTTTKSPSEGSGLGLTLAANVINKHSGKLELARTSGPTVFRISLPIDK